MPWSHNVTPFYNVNIDMAVIAVRVNGSGTVSYTHLTLPTIYSV